MSTSTITTPPATAHTARSSWAATPGEPWGRVGALWSRAPIVLHQAVAGDTGGLVEMFSNMSPGARRLRFFQAMPRIPRSMVRYLCDVDQDRHRAWLAHAGGDGGPIIGEVRGVRDAARPESAEVALAVRDDWTGLGLGRALLEWIFADLASRGVTTITCEVLPDNRRSIDLFRSMGLDFRFDGGVLAGRGPAGISRDAESAPW